MAEETAWLIETGRGEFWNGKGLNRSSFVKEPEAAIRFAREVDAEIVRVWLFDNLGGWMLRAVEHKWINAGLLQRD